MLYLKINARCTKDSFTVSDAEVISKLQLWIIWVKNLKSVINTKTCEKSVQQQENNDFLLDKKYCTHVSLGAIHINFAQNSSLKVSNKLTTLTFSLNIVRVSVLCVCVYATRIRIVFAYALTLLLTSIIDRVIYYRKSIKITTAIFNVTKFESSYFATNLLVKTNSDIIWAVFFIRVHVSLFIYT